MTHRLNGDACWVIWVGARQWEGLSGAFDVGQSGWVCPQDEAAERFRFFPALSAESAWLYQVVCVAKDFLRVATREHV